MASMLTTSDNPYSPFTQFDDWAVYDEDNGYYSCEYLARIANVSESMSVEESDIEIENAIDEIIKVNPLGIFVKATESNGTS